MKITALNQKIADTQAELNRLLGLQAEREAMSEERQAATALHEIQCTSNHTDGCGWYYENESEESTWNIGTTHEKYLRMIRDAKREYTYMSYEDILAFAREFPRCNMEVAHIIDSVQGLSHRL